MFTILNARTHIPIKGAQNIFQSGRDSLYARVHVHIGMYYAVPIYKKRCRNCNRPLHT